MRDDLPTVAILGGTGALGSGLARRWANAGFPLIIGSREQARAETAARSLCDEMKSNNVRGMANAAAAEAADIVVMTVPFEYHGSTIQSVRDAVQGKIFVDTTVPLVPPKLGTVQLPPSGSVAVTAQELLGDDVMVVSAFQNIGAQHLRQNSGIDHQVLVSGNKRTARDSVIELVEAAGLTGWHAGPIANATAAEALTSILITINRHHNLEGAGIKITGVPKSDE
jgi:NADPH-dependent F420 reductase